MKRITLALLLLANSAHAAPRWRSVLKTVFVGMLLATSPGAAGDDSSSTAAPNVDCRGVPTMHDSLEHMQRVVEVCEAKCSFSADVGWACFDTCVKEDSQRTEDYLTRLFTAGCQGRPFDERFNFEPSDCQKFDEMSGTIKAYDTMKGYPDVRQCVGAKVRENNRRLESVLSRLQGWIQSRNLTFAC